jgi:hypothetical protein
LIFALNLEFANSLGVIHALIGIRSTIFEKSESTLPEDHPCQAWLLYVEQARLKCEEKINEDI